MTAPVSSPLGELLGVSRPVLLAPMAGVAGGALAAAVSRAGGLGFVGGGYGGSEWLSEQMAEVDDVRVGVGLITWNMAADALDRVLAYRPAAVWLSFGDPTPHVGAVRDSGAVAVCQVTSVAESTEAVAAGAQVIVAQGSESGGHGRSGRSLFGLLPAVVDAVAPVPVVAAGGIVDARGYLATRAFGGVGVALGTAFYATHEALDSDQAKRQLVERGGDETVRSVVYDLVRGPGWPAGYDGRSLRSELTDTWIGREAELAADPAPVIERYRRAVADQDMSQRVVWAGEGIDGIESITSAAEVVKRFPAIAET